MRHHLLPHTSSLLLCLSALSGRMEAQPASPPCTLDAGELRPIVLQDGTYGVVFPQDMSVRGDSLLILGLALNGDAHGRKIQRSGDAGSLVGFLLTDHRRMATPIPAPHGLSTARYFRMHRADRGWEVVFFVPDRDTSQGSRAFDTGTFWHSRLVATRWTEVERIGRVVDAVVMRPNSSGLAARDGELQFAVFYGKVMGAGGVLIWRRTRHGAWRADSIHFESAPLSVTAASNESAPQFNRFFPVVGVRVDSQVDAGSLLSVRADKPSEWTMVLRAPTESMNQPVVIERSDTLHVSWWEFATGEVPSLWYQSLESSHVTAPAGRQRVTRGVNEFSFLEVQEGERSRLVWAYRSPSTVDSAEVAVVANGEPVVVGRTAFPFAFMTRGVASGDRSFILATLPRPVPDGEPSASRTLEIRVNCNEGT